MIIRQIKTNHLISQLNIYQISFFIIVFFLLTIIGTLSHEIAHYIVAKHLGLYPILHYGNVTFGNQIQLLHFDDELNRRFFLCSIAGPLQTIITGLIGFTILIVRNRVRIKTFSKIDFIATFLSLFWLRECFNLITIIISSIFNKTVALNGDEIYISNYLGFNPFFFNLTLGIMGAIICFVTVFKLLPTKYRLNIIIGSLFGTCIGFVIWFYFLGKIVLP